MVSETSRDAFRVEIAGIAEQAGAPEREAFARWVCLNVLGIDDAATDEAVSIGGRGAFGVDAFYAEEGGDPDERYVCWIQAKYSKGLDQRVTREDMEAFASTLSRLRRCPPEANRVFRQKSAELARMEGACPDVKKRMILAVAGEADEQVRAMLQDRRWIEDRLGPDARTSVRLDVLDMNGILSQMAIPGTPTLRVKFDGDVICKKDGASKSVIGHVGAGRLVQLAKKHKEALFLSPGQALEEQAPTHRAILNTLSDERARSRFWKMNNGITAVCARIEAAGSEYNVDDFKIVDGRQTLRALQDAACPIEGVSVLLSVHEAEDAKERGRISEAARTQNPTKPADRVANYREMTDLARQCGKEFPEFYFERRTGGFQSAPSAVQDRVTRRRVMKKTAVARAYCAYSLHPHDAIVPDRVMFSPADVHYDRIFKDRAARELVLPHIFMHLFEELHREWCKELQDDPSDDTARNKGISSKDTVKYYMLKFVHESMTGLDKAVRASVEDALIESFRSLKKNDRVPAEMMGVARAAYDSFMVSFDANRMETWPAELIKKIESKGHKESKDDVPSPYDVMSVLREKGDVLLPNLLRTRARTYRQIGGDPVQSKLRAIADAPR